MVRTAWQAAEVQLQLPASAQDLYQSTTALCIGKRAWKHKSTQVIQQPKISQPLLALPLC